MYRLFKHTQGGFTLVELMIVIQIIAILIAPMIYLELVYREKFEVNVSRQDMVESGNRTLEWIARDIRTANNIKGKWLTNTPVADRLIIETTSGKVVVYSYVQQKKAITRSQFDQLKSKEPSEVVTLGSYVEDLVVKPLDSIPSMYQVRIDFYKEFLKSSESISMNLFVAWRLK